MPSISIITATYNASGTLRDNLECVQHQNIQVEHILIDGDSTDGTIGLLERYKEKKGISYLSEPDNGMYDAINKGIRMATGEVIGLLHADDFYADKLVLQSVANVFENENVDSCFGDLKYVNQDNPEKIVRLWQAGRCTKKKFYWGWMPPHPTFFVRRSIYEKLGGYRLDMGTAADYELMLRFLLKHQISTVYIPQVLIKMRTGGVSNISLINRINAHRMDSKAWKVNGLKPYPWTIPMKPVRKITQWFTRP